MQLRLGHTRPVAGVIGGRARPRAGLRPVRPAAMLALVMTAAGAVACHRDGPAPPDVVIEVSLAPEPPGVGPAQLDIRLRTRDGTPVDAARVRMEGHMAHPGMAPVIGDAARQAPGTYVASFDFTMRGDWIVLVTADLPDGRHVEQRIDLRVTGPGA